MSKWHDSAKAIATFVDTADDWNWVSQKTPRTATISRALGLLIELCDKSDLPAPSRVAACPMGGILIVWEEPGCYLDAEITPSGEVLWMREHDGQPVEHGVGTQYDKIEWMTKEKR